MLKRKQWIWRQRMSRCSTSKRSVSCSYCWIFSIFWKVPTFWYLCMYTRRPRWRNFEHDYDQNCARIKLIFSDRCYGKKLYLAQFWAQSIKYLANLEHTLQFSALFCGQNCTCFRIAPSWRVQYRAKNRANKITNSYFLCDITNIRSWIIPYLLTWEFILFYCCQSLLFTKSLWNSYQRIAIYC